MKLVKGLDKIVEEFNTTGNINSKLVNENNDLQTEIINKSSIDVFQKELKVTLAIYSDNPCTSEYYFCKNSAYQTYYSTYCPGIPEVPHPWNNGTYCHMSRYNKLMSDLDICELRYCSGAPNDDGNGDGEPDGPVPFGN